MQLAECFPALNFVKICLPKKQMMPKTKVNVLKLGDKVNILVLAELGGIVGKMGQEYTVRYSALCILNLQFFLNSGFLGTRCPQTPKLY
jgi:hypothetical protein